VNSFGLVSHKIPFSHACLQKFLTCYVPKDRQIDRQTETLEFEDFKYDLKCRNYSKKSRYIKSLLNCKCVFYFGPCNTWFSVVYAPWKRKYIWFLQWESFMYLNNVHCRVCKGDVMCFLWNCNWIFSSLFFFKNTISLLKITALLVCVCSPIGFLTDFTKLFRSLRKRKPPNPPQLHFPTISNSNMATLNSWWETTVLFT
jgi:hypothetical protein